MPTEIESRARSDRRKWFREYMQRLNPTSPAQSVINLGLASKSLHNSLYKRMATRADLDPGSQQLLVGGIGSGKTTELLLTQQFLKEELRSLALYMDISYETDLSGANSGALLASLGQHLLKAFHVLNLEAHPSRLLQAQSELNSFAFGGTALELIPSDVDWESVLTLRTKGKLKSAPSES